MQRGTQYARFVVDVPTFSSARGDDEILLDGTILWGVVGHINPRVVLVEFLLECGIVDIAFDDQISCVLVDGAVCTDLQINV